MLQYAHEAMRYSIQVNLLEPFIKRSHTFYVDLPRTLFALLLLCGFERHLQLLIHAVLESEISLVVSVVDCAHFCELISPVEYLVPEFFKLLPLMFVLLL